MSFEPMPRPTGEGRSLPSDGDLLSAPLSVRPFADATNRPPERPACSTTLVRVRPPIPFRPSTSLGRRADTTPPSDETSPSAGSSPAFLLPASLSARAGSFTPLRPGASLAVALSPRQDARRGAQPNMPSPPTRSRRPGPSRHRRLALSLLVASALVSVPQAAALGQDLALGSGGEHLLSESLSSPARPVRPPPAPAAADVGPSIPAGVKPLSVAASPDIAALPSQASSSSGRRLSSTAVIGSGSVDAGDEPGTRRTTSYAKSSGSANDGWLAHPHGSRRQHDAFSAAQASGPEVSSIFKTSAAEDSESEIAASRFAVPRVRGRRRSESSATGDSQTARQRQSIHRRLAKRQQEAELELTGPSEAAKTEGGAALLSTAVDSPSTAAALPASTISALADSLSSVPGAATASPSATSISGTQEPVGGEPSSSTKTAGGGRPIPTLSNSLPAPDPLYVT
jgi:hypothetical protein